MSNTKLWTVPMETATELGLDNLIFSYMGMHLPHHRKQDQKSPPVCPFGVFIKVGDFAFNHGAPSDRDYKKNDLVNEDEIDRYFLLPADLQKLITHRILTDEDFQKDFMVYFGNPKSWEDEDYYNHAWKKKGELCYFENVSPEHIKAILWPVWEQYVDDVAKVYKPDGLQEYSADFSRSFPDIDIIFYRPYHDAIDNEKWNVENMRDWELALVKASSLAQEFYLKFGIFPESISDAKIALNSQT